MNEEFYDKVNENLRKSWEVHRQAFGPIIEPAFKEDANARIILINALNHISRRNCKRGLELLNSIRDLCSCDEDKAAWSFFVGVAFEMTGSKENSLKWYDEAGKFHHRFFMPYIKLAKAAHADGQLEKAKKYYMMGIQYLKEMPEKDVEGIFFGSSYANFACCLAQAGEYENARLAFEEAIKYPLIPDAYATGAIIYAALGDRQKSEHYLGKLNEQSPEAAKAVSDEIARLFGE